MKLVVTMRVLPKIYFSGAENRFSVHTAVREIFGGHFPWERYFFFFVQNFFPGTIFFFFPHFIYEMWKKKNAVQAMARLKFFPRFGSQLANKIRERLFVFFIIQV